MIDMNSSGALPPRRPAVSRPGPTRPWGVFLLGLCAVVLSACQVRVATEIVVNDEGGGTLGMTIALDEDIVTSFELDGFDPFEGLDALPSPWVGEVAEDGGDRALVLSADFDSPADLASLVEALEDGLDEEDPAVLTDIELRPEAQGWRLEAMAGLRPPSSTGIIGGLIAFDGQALEELLARTTDPVMTVELRVTLPGQITDSNADEVHKGTATWRLEPTGLVEIRAVSEPAEDRVGLVLVAVGIGAALLLGLMIGRRVRRR